MNPGRMTETPTPWGRRSARSDSPKPRRPNLVAAYSDEAGAAALPDSEDMNTMWPLPRCDHRRQQRSGEGDRRAQVDLEHRVDLLLAEVLQYAVGRQARVCHEHLDARVHRLLRQPVDLGSRLRSHRVARVPSSCASASRTSSRRPVSSRRVPRAASARAIAAPSPPVAPVTSAVLSASAVRDRVDTAAESKGPRSDCEAGPGTRPRSP